MTEFTLGVASSLAATAATVGLGWLLSRRVRWWLLSAASRLSGLGALRVHRHQDDAKSELSEEIGRARWLRVMVGRGNELTRDGFTPLWRGGGRPPDSVRVLLPDPHSPGPGGNWLERRERELISVDPGFSPGLLSEQVLANFHYLAQASREGANTEIRLYDLPNLYRVVATDNIAFITLYRSAEHGRHSPCIVAHRPGELYDFALRIFDTAWDSARVPGDTPSLDP
ncbi:MULTISPECIES: hypothetical protein [Nocardiopsis]|uniref:Uncharacterized protein n=1 Tax=Nocardiopsis dassonvillei (strain ATCC 23218 / DSM 43111 / CIP 107115 / JCM 7437 / KCTC 9190 / NBRC 14626 / NCTC 10488 / NRRL B-5397 / IMRU 509) TaxID=446468 RepID=D7B7N4_NOCDD|nr:MULTISPECIES: hypothetical protein [Nocardiopsis]ADH69429.1 conserved hypothetical protein [Nocardiopsis dassonvillei subsp. dassonvillei DSM 43111]APC37442.1 hypothetical protein A9R04_23425 [Nocardiopsis dassonvillei]NKY79181.1 hypothetical protein [Nocardiopsis dassonvillei]VEI89939.1 Uncharacterised protein [Nocardiopsis dassonvillei]